MDRLVVRGARQHNLQGVDVDLPRDRLVVLTGPSGSGKSSLAFDTIFAEGQRRYVESLSAYARQFLDQLPKPRVESIEGLSPAIAIEQKPLSKSPRSTVGTVTEIADFLRLLFARVGVPHCPVSGRVLHEWTAQEIVDEVLARGDGAKAVLLAPRVRRGGAPAIRAEIDRLRRDGYVRARLGGEVIDLSDEPSVGDGEYDLEVVVDRIVVRDGVRGRLTDSVELALRLGDGTLLLDAADGSEPEVRSERLVSWEFGITLPPLEPRLFSFNSPHGACPACDGLGVRSVIDPARIVPDPRRTLREGAVAAFGARGTLATATEVDALVRATGISPDVPWEELPEADRQLVLFGGRSTRRRRTDEYEGVVPRLERMRETGTMSADDTEPAEDGTIGPEDLGRFLVQQTCESCNGARLRPEALSVRLGGRSIAELARLPLRELADALRELITAGSLSARDRAVAEPLLRTVVDRLGFLIGVGLDYLSLDRPVQTLSGGEGQRIRLATQIGASLVGVLYVLDEPSIGLHARDNERLLAALRQLVDKGNTVLVVEHDREAILAADVLVDMGPGAGVHGGRIVAQGTPEEVMACPASVTGPYLTGERRLPVPATRNAPGPAALRVVGARAHNLKALTVAIPIGLLTAVTGVSGSGKSSLVTDTLLPGARALLYGAGGVVGACDAIEGLEHIDKVISIDQAPIGRTPRSNPATYTGIFAHLRELFAGLAEARARGYKPGRFSFNVKGGRCETCQGDGVLRIEMHFLPDVYVECDACEGRRYNRETLEVAYRGLSIADVLDLTVDAVYDVFDAIPRVRDRLSALRQVGLGYVKLGQSATTLSGGEAQRVKLAAELSRKATGRTLYVLDEPTTGLHFQDTELLLHALAGLRDAGNTVVVIEHNLDLVACADWVIDLGPEGGSGGGRVVAEGTPEQVANTPGSHTGAHLRRVLEAARAPATARRAPKPRGTAPAQPPADRTSPAGPRGRAAPPSARTQTSRAPQPLIAETASTDGRSESPSSAALSASRPRTASRRAAAAAPSGAPEAPARSQRPAGRRAGGTQPAGAKSRKR